MTTPQLNLDYTGNTSGPNAVNLQNGTLQTDSISTQGSATNSVFNFSGGTLQPVDSGVTGGIGCGCEHISLALSGSNAVMSSTDSTGVGRSVPIYANLVGSSGVLTTVGAGTLVLAGSNTSFNGTIAVNSGTLQVGNAIALGSGGLTVKSGVVDLPDSARRSPAFQAGPAA